MRWTVEIIEPYPKAFSFCPGAKAAEKKLAEALGPPIAALDFLV